MSIYNKINKRPSISDLADIGPKEKGYCGWRKAYNNKEEIKYINSLKNTKDILDYRDERETEVFLNNI